MKRGRAREGAGAVRPVTGQHTFQARRFFHFHRATWAEALFALAVIGAPLALGSVHVLAQVVLASVLLLAFAGAAWRLSREGREVRVGWIGLALFVALAWSFVQWLPLPSGLVATLSPASYEARAAVAGLADEDVPGWMPLALDAGRAAAGIVSLLAVTLAYLTASSLRQDSDVRARLASYVEASALAVLGAAILHKALGLTAIWGVYEPATSALPAFASSFVNPNHAAALMLLGAFVAFGASLSPERAQRVHLAIGVALSVGVLASLSRANALLLGGGLALFTLVPLASKRFARERGQLVRLFVGTACCLFVALVVVGPERWLAELGTLGETSLSKQGVFTWCWSIGVDVLGVAPLVGTGPGAFGVASTPLLGSADETYLAYAHHGVLQVLADLGLAVGGLVLALVGGAFVRMARAALRGPGGLTVWAMLVGLALVALQNLVDFSLWIPGVAIPAAAVLGLAVESTWEPRRPARRVWFPAWRWPPWALAIPLGVLIVTAVPAYRERPEAWKGEAHAALAAGPERAERVAAIDRAALATAHPHDYLALASAAALAEASGRDGEAAGWLERALTLAPHDAGTLAAAIRMRLRARDDAGASVLIERLERGGIGRAAPLVLDAPWAVAVRAAYFAGPSARALLAAEELDRRGRAVEGDELLLAALARVPDRRPLYAQLAGRRWGDAPFLARLALTCQVEAAALEPGARAPWVRIADLAQGRVEALAGRHGHAFRLFMAAADATAAAGETPPDEVVRPLVEAGKAALALGRLDWLDDVLARLEARTDITRWSAWPRGEYHVLRSERAERRGDVAGAIRAMHEALRHLGHVATLHERLAHLYARAGDDEASARAAARAKALEARP